MVRKLITLLTPLFVGKFLYSQIHDWSGNGGGKVPNGTVPENFQNFRNSEKFEKELLIRNK